MRASQVLTQLKFDPIQESGWLPDKHRPMVPKAWDQSWDWFQQLPASAHMFSESATESYRPEGSFPWDKGHALSSI